MNSIASSNIGNDAFDNDNDNMTDMSDIINQNYDNSKYNKLVVTKEGEIDPSHLLITEGITTTIVIITTTTTSTTSTIIAATITIITITTTTITIIIIIIIINK